MVPRRNWTKLRGFTLPLSDFLLVLCGRILPDRFRAPDTYWKTTLNAINIKPQFSQQFFMGCDGADDARTLVTNLVNFLQYGF